MIHQRFLTLCIGALGLLSTLSLDACQRTLPAAADRPALTIARGSDDWHANGVLRKACLREPAELAGLPCRDWVHFNKDGTLMGARLAQDACIGSASLPAETYVWLDAQGRLEGVWLSRDTEILGHVCRGGRGKVSTSFYPDGALRAFFPREDAEIDGVPCEASLVHPVYLHANGRLRQARLARALTREGHAIPGGTTVVLDETGRVIEQPPE